MSQVAPGPLFMNGPNIIFLKAKHQDEPKQLVQTVLTSNLIVSADLNGFDWTQGFHLDLIFQEPVQVKPALLVSLI